MRINKFLATNYSISRRKAEDWVKEGQVKVNGKVLESLAFDVRENDFVEVEGQKQTPKKSDVYLAFHKPKACVCTNSDEHGRKTVFDFLPEHLKEMRLFCVGRLDYDTEGLLILTNDGDLANKLMHPSKQIEKVYVANISGEFTEQKAKQLRAGVVLDDGYKTAPAKVKVLGKRGGGELTRVQITICEGKNKQIKRMVESVKCAVEFLVRKQVGPITLGGLQRGTFRELNKKEIAELKAL